ncbi:YhcH/YjgK/YiaL family protein [Pseudopedobacter beijingensis]|uniref:YhcH/YjgK/YiaL family protein n=1 Tax=Pseudopedobacter beijingensis TaxID=1207056 RepID=A0ABW4I8L4_9SPHI
MNRKQYILSVFFIWGIFGCTSKRIDTPPNFKIAHHTIISKFKPQVDPSVDIKVLKEQYQKYPERWETAFKFLAETNLDTLKYGRYDLSNDVYVNYSKGKTKDLKDCKYERHQQWIDLQYMVEGEEYMGKNAAYNQLKVIQPYNEKKDVALYEYDGKPLALANPQNYFIFFPTEAHIPTVKVGEIKETRKLVIKIRYN